MSHHAEKVELTLAEKRALRRATGHTSSACEDYPCVTCTAVERAVERIICAREVAAEQRGREDNADHGMCYVSGSRALDALKASAPVGTVTTEWNVLRNGKPYLQPWTEDEGEARSYSAGGLIIYRTRTSYPDSVTRWASLCDCGVGDGSEAGHDLVCSRVVGPSPEGVALVALRGTPGASS